MLFAFFGLELFLFDIIYRGRGATLSFCFLFNIIGFCNLIVMYVPWCDFLCLLCLVFFELYGCVGLQF